MKSFVPLLLAFAIGAGHGAPRRRRILPPSHQSHGQVRQGRQRQAPRPAKQGQSRAPRPQRPTIDYDGEQVNFGEWQAVRDFEDEMVAARLRPRRLERCAPGRFIDSAVQLVKPAPPGKPKNWQAYSERFIEPIRINAGVRFWNENAALARAEAIVWRAGRDHRRHHRRRDHLWPRHRTLPRGRRADHPRLCLSGSAEPQRPHAVLPQRAGKHPAAGAQGKHRSVLAAGLVCRRRRHAAVHAGQIS
jgi:hypothetical protein